MTLSVRVWKLWACPLVIEKQRRKCLGSLSAGGQPRVLIKQTGNVCSPGSCHVYDLLFLKNNAAGSDSPHQCGPCWHKSTSHTPSWVICKPQGEATWALTDHWQALPRHLRRLTASAALFSNLALKYAAVFNSQLLSARLAVSVQKCRVCLTFLKRFCNRGKRLSWPQCVISGTLPVWYSVLHSAGFITLEADTLVAR